MQLVYQVGELDIDLDNLKYEGVDPDMAAHRFIVELEESSEGFVASIYVAPVRRHRVIALKHEIDESKIAGGGEIFLDRENRLVLADFSGDYGAVPNYAAKAFGHIIEDILEKRGVKITDVLVDMYEEKLNEKWLNLDQI